MDDASRRMDYGPYDLDTRRRWSCGTATKRSYGRRKFTEMERRRYEQKGNRTYKDRQYGRKRESTEGQGAGKKVKVREVQFDQESEVHEGKGRNTELGIVTYTFVFLFLMLADI